MIHPHCATTDCVNSPDVLPRMPATLISTLSAMTHHANTLLALILTLAILTPTQLVMEAFALLQVVLTQLPAIMTPVQGVITAHVSSPVAPTSLPAIFQLMRAVMTAAAVSIPAKPSPSRHLRIQSPPE